jgi:hypothetical protein
MGCPHDFCQNMVYTQNCFALHFHKHMTCLSAGLLRICQFFLSHIKLCIGGLRLIAVLRAIYDNIALNFLRMRNVSYKVEDKIKTHFPCSKSFSENRAFVKQCGENILQLDRLRMKIQYGA